MGGHLFQLRPVCRHRVRLEHLLRPRHAILETAVQIIAEGLRPVLGLEQARSMAHATFGLINSTPHSALLPDHAMGELLHRMALHGKVANMGDKVEFMKGVGKGGQPKAYDARIVKKLRTFQKGPGRDGSKRKSEGGAGAAAQFKEEIRHSPPPSPLRRQGPR